MGVPGKWGDVEWVRKIFFYDCIWKEDEIIFFSWERNALCRMDMEGFVTKIGEVPDESDCLCLFPGICETDGMYLLEPYAAAGDFLVLFDSRKHDFIKIPIESEWRKYLSFKEENVYGYGEFIYIFQIYPGILKMNVATWEIEYITYPNTNMDMDRIGETIKYGEKIYAPLKNRNKLYIFDLRTEGFEEKTFDIDMNGICTFTYGDGKFWFTTKEKEVYMWNEKSNIFEVFTEYPRGFGTIIRKEGVEPILFNASVYINGIVYLIPAYANMLVALDTATGGMKEIYIIGEEETEESINRLGRPSMVKYLFAKKKGNKILLESMKNKCVYIIDTVTREVKKIVPKWKMDMEMYGNIRGDRVCTELSSYLGLGSLVKSLFQREKSKNQSEDIFFGEKIWQIVKL